MTETDRTAPDSAAAAPPAADRDTTVTAFGEGAVSVAPDLWVVRVASTADAADASEATASLASNVARLRAALANSSLPVESVQTTDFSVFQRDTDNESEYTARQVFRVEVSNTSAVGEVVDIAVDSVGTEVFGVEFVLSETTRERLRSEAIERAVADAREQATAAANAANVTLRKPASVEVVGQTVGPLS